MRYDDTSNRLQRKLVELLELFNADDAAETTTDPDYVASALADITDCVKILADQHVKLGVVVESLATPYGGIDRIVARAFERGGAPEA